MLLNLHPFILAASAVTLCLVACCTQNRETRADCKAAVGHVDERDVAKAVNVFIEMPGWLEVSRKKTDLMKSLQMLSLFPTDVIRAAEMAYLSSGLEHKVWKLDKIFIAHRYIFAVPPEPRPEEVRFFGGWLGTLQAPRSDMLWPFREQKNGALELITTHAGYLGPEYVPLEEFDFFRERFPRRAVSDPRSDNP